MRSAGSRSKQHAPWLLVDGGLQLMAHQQVASDVLALANSEWAADVSLDLLDGFVADFLGQHRVTTMLGADHVLADQGDQLRTRLRHIAGVQLRLQATARHVLEILADAGIDTRVLKGMASAELDYPEPHLRQSGDVDLAVPAAQFEHAISCLKKHGFRDHHTENSDFLLPGTTLDSPHGIEIDIHTRLFQRSPMSSILFDDPDPLPGLPGSGMSPNLRLVHAAGHFILAPPDSRRMSGLVDVTRLRLNPRTDFDAAREIAAELKVEGLVGAALRLEMELSGRSDLLYMLDPWAKPDWLDRNTRLVPLRRLSLDHLNRFREVEKGQRLRYLPTWLLPDERQRKLASAAVRKKTSEIKAAMESLRGQP